MRDFAMVTLASVLACVGCGDSKSAEGARNASAGSGGTTSGAGSGGTSGAGSSGMASSGASGKEAGSSGKTGAAGSTSTGDAGASDGSAGKPAGAGGSSAGASGAGGGGQSGSDDLCANATEERPGSGTIKCDGGLVHRASPGQCEPYEQSSEPLPASALPAGDECLADVDCDAKPYGKCEWGAGTYLNPRLSNDCVYGCTTDADCDAGSVCDCSSTGGWCRKSSCTVDADCASGLCARRPPGCVGSGFDCHTPEDECTVNEDCEGTLECTSYQGGAWRCNIAGCPS